MTPKSELIVSVSGIRGIIGESLTPEAAVRFACAYGTYLVGQKMPGKAEHGPKVVLARDSRRSGEMIRHAIIAGLLSTGCVVEEIGIAPTPTVGIAVRQLHAAGGIQITASHNPSPWNGLKMFGPNGAVLPAARGNELKAFFETNQFALGTWDRLGSVGVPPSITAEHAELVRQNISVATIAAGRFRVLLDGNGGAGGPLGEELLASLGCEVIHYNCEPNGVFVHEPEPTPAHLVDVAPWIPQREASVGFVLDPDADRLAIIDETGTCISEELTLALAVKFRLRQQRGPVVVNMSTSRVVADLAAAAKCEFFRSAVGEANVVEVMRACGAVIGGEGNGGVIDPRIGWVRDPFIGMALILSLMAEEGRPLSKIVADLPQYAMLKSKVTVAREQLPAAFAALSAAFPDATVDTVDGLRLDGPDWWLHVRGSNTEPIVRIIAESPTSERTQELCDHAAALLKTGA